MPYRLPNKYSFEHSFVFFLYNILAKIVKTGEQKGIFYHSFNLKSVDDANKIKGMSNSDIFDFLQKNGYESEIDELVKRQIFDAVLSDFLQFLYTALETSEKAQLSVSFALLRKPFKDNLLILEWLLADSNDFFVKFKSENSRNEIAIDKISREKKLSIISKANSKIRALFLSADFIYELRYDKTKSYSLESLWNRANHLITNYNNYATEDMNLNFVFSQESDKIKQWDSFYHILPSLLIQTILVSDAIYKSFTNDNSIIDNELFYRIVYAYILSTKQFKEPDENLPKITPVICKKCNTELEIDEKNEKLIYQKGYFRCKKRHKNYLFKL